MLEHLLAVFRGLSAYYHLLKLILKRSLRDESHFSPMSPYEKCWHTVDISIPLVCFFVFFSKQPILELQYLWKASVYHIKLA